MHNYQNHNNHYKYTIMDQKLEYPKIEKIKFTSTVDTLMTNTIQNKTNIPECLVQEIVEASGFQSNDQNTYKLMAHFIDKWMIDITGAMIEKHSDRYKKKDKDQPRDDRIQITTDDISLVSTQ
ncbi:hypothetical protein pb186bvf_000020 [Paramecium bursaria]